MVTENILSNIVCVGVPARGIKTSDEYYGKSRLDGVKTKKLKANDKKEFKSRI